VKFVNSGFTLFVWTVDLTNREFYCIFCIRHIWPINIHPGLKVRGIRGGLSSPPPSSGDWCGRLREGIREMGKR